MKLHRTPTLAPPPNLLKAFGKKVRWAWLGLYKGFPSDPFSGKGVRWVRLGCTGCSAPHLLNVSLARE